MRNSHIDLLLQDAISIQKSGGWNLGSLNAHTTQIKHSMMLFKYRAALGLAMSFEGLLVQLI